MIGMNRYLEYKQAEDYLDQVICVNDTTGFFAIHKQDALISNKED